MQRPYFEARGITIYHGDARELAPLLTGNVVVTDPPYGQTSLPWDKWVDGWPSLVQPNALWCCGSLRMFMDQRSDFSAAGFHMAQDLVWEKQNGSGFAADRFRRVHEQIVHFYRGAWTEQYNEVPKTMDALARVIHRKAPIAHMSKISEHKFTSDEGDARFMRSVLRIRNEHGQALHPTQKPVALMRVVIECSCPPAGTVIDLFMGSGTVLVAAKQLGRVAIGIEQSEEHCETAARRLTQELALAELFV